MLTVISRQWALPSSKAEKDLAEFDQGQVLRLRYEDFVEDPIAHLKRVCDHCGLQLTEEMVKAASDSVKSDRQQKWHRLDPLDLARILPELGEEMARHGYEVPEKIAQVMHE
jgi:LPS sulfotransferase NodH